MQKVSAKFFTPPNQTHGDEKLSCSKESQMVFCQEMVLIMGLIGYLNMGWPGQWGASTAWLVLYFGWLVRERKIEHFPAAWLHACKSRAHGYRNTLLASMCRCMQPIGFFTSKRDGDACCGPGWRKPGSVVRAWPNGETNQSDPTRT